MIRNIYISNKSIIINTIKKDTMPLKLFKFINKRGVSPIIATVLLISFAVALGTVVLNWGRSLDISDSGDICSGIGIKLRNLNNLQACYIYSGNEAYINFIIDNIGNKDVDGLGIWITGESGTQLLDLNDLTIKTGNLLDIKDNSVKYNLKTYGAIKNIQFFPKIKNIDSIELCARQSVKAVNLGIC